MNISYLVRRKSHFDKLSVTSDSINIFLLLFLFLILFNSAYPQYGFVSVKDKEIIAPDSKPILLKGINLGNWLNPEGYMFRFNNVNSFRLIDNTIKELIGADEARKFWQTFRDNYITKEDINWYKNEK